MKTNIKTALAFATACLPAIVLVTWLNAYYWLLEGGRYRAFIQPKLWPLLVFAMLLLIGFIAAFIAQFSWKGPIRAGAGAWLGAAVLLTPVLFLWTVHGQSLGSHAFLNKTAGLSASPAFPGSVASRQPGTDSGANEITLLSLLTSPDAFDGRTVVVEGLVYRDPQLPANVFRLFRFAVICCAADALPATIRVELAGGGNLANDTWVQVTGRFEQKGVAGRPTAVIRAESVRPVPIPPPEKRYLFF